MAELIFGARNLRGHLLARHQAAAERERLIVELQQARARVKTLRWLIPICSKWPQHGKAAFRQFTVNLAFIAWPGWRRSQEYECYPR